MNASDRIGVTVLDSLNQLNFPAFVRPCIEIDVKDNAVLQASIQVFHDKREPYREINQSNVLETRV